MSYRKFLNVLLLVVFYGFMSVPGTWAQVQTPLNSGSIPQFKDPLPDLNIFGLNNGPNNTIETIPAGSNQIILNMEEFKANLLPTGFVPPGIVPPAMFTGTWVWGYRQALPTSTQNTFTGPVIIATRGNPTEIKYINNLGETATSNLLAYTRSTDQTLHWANPNNLGMNNPALMVNYFGPIPAVPHLHGGEIPPVLDGGPDAWFLSNAYTPAAFPGYSAHGKAYYSKDDPNNTSTHNYSIYRYTNEQEPANIWFHDHTLGATRLNVYAGIAGGYILQDTNAFYQNLPGPIVPLVIQDRMFDTTGQLFFPNVGLNPTIHPFWIPEFIGDTILVNGKVWPFMNVAPQRYRFLIINGSNARTYDLNLQSMGGKNVVVPIWQIGTDGGYLDFPVQVGTKAVPLRLMPGERADLIIDFTGLPVGTTLLVNNTAKSPFPGGAPPQGSTVGRIMKFTVVATDANHSAGTFVPTAATALRGGGNQVQKIVRLPGAPAPAGSTAGPALVLPLNAGANVQKWRQLTLNEIMGPAGPQEILVNNTKWSGKQPDMMTPVLGYSVQDVAGNYITEYPNEGDTEVWDIINTTADTHPIHLHLTQFQLISRQPYDVKGYLAAYGAAFPAGVGINMAGPGTANYLGAVYVPGFGPPRDYSLVQQAKTAAGAVVGNFIGGNVDVTPFLKGAALPPPPNEMGWKDTVQMNPGEVTRIVARFAPMTKALNDPNLYYPFDPNVFQRDYVWHCHIIDHEDNEMMRPYQVNPNTSAVRTYVQGTHY